MEIQLDKYQGILKKQPETEQEYWETIESLGGQIFYMNHELADGRIEDPDGSISEITFKCQEALQTIADEAFEKFNLSWEKDVDGKTYYWDWYHEKKKEFLESNQ